MFSKILIANRGEIACRIIRTCAKMNINTVAVYSDADANSMHVAMADEAFNIGPAPVSDSYLRGDLIIDAACATQCQAIHPGYGFLSENPDFVEQVEAAGLTFIGPNADAIRAMGLKDAAKKLMEEAGVPVVPGYHGDNQDREFLAKQAEICGYPVLIKARAGGGGKGMRKVDEASAFFAALEGAQREGIASFGDGHVLIEKFVMSPRHIEVQVFGDQHGNGVHLYERDCSLQRRHQKVIEEAPAPGMTDEMRHAMTSAAVDAVKAINYSNAGTIEFIVDGSDGLHPDRFWFMEMNTRLQVEHPVTECITGLDLVEWQLRVANGETLPLTQQDIPLNGHAFEARVYAEDVAKGFLPAIGTLHHVQLSSDTRNDTGVRCGDAITPFYDPMISKIVTWGKTRDQALQRLKRGLAETQIGGTVTNVAFLGRLADQVDFANGNVDTGLIDRNLPELLRSEPLEPKELAFAALIILGFCHPTEFASFRLFGSAHSRQVLIWEGKPRTAEIDTIREKEGLKHLVRLEEHSFEFSNLSKVGNVFTSYESGSKLVLSGVRLGDDLILFKDCDSYTIQIEDPLKASETGGEKGNHIVAPMPGSVKQVYCSLGDQVNSGDALLVLEAMKMEHTLTAPQDGKVSAVHVLPLDQVEDGSVLIELDVDDE